MPIAPFEIASGELYVGREHFDEFGAQLISPPVALGVTATIFNNCIRRPDAKRAFIHDIDDFGMRRIIGREPHGPRQGLDIALREELGITAYELLGAGVSTKTRHCAQYVISCESLVELTPTLSPDANLEDSYLYRLAQHLTTSVKQG